MMGYAAIIGNLGEGRYRIKIDSGESRRLVLVAAANQALAEVGSKIAASYSQVQLADQLEAESRDAINAIIDMLVLESDPVAVGLAQQVLAIEQERYARLVASNQPVRQQYATLKSAQADLLRQRAKWESLQAVTYKEAWCTDYTLDGTGEYVATIDIPGDSSLTLLAPGCRGARNGDGAISTERKTTGLNRLTAQKYAFETALAAVTTSIEEALGEVPALRIAAAAANAALVAAPYDPGVQAAAKAADKALKDKISDITALQTSKTAQSSRLKGVEVEIATLSARPAKDVPQPGDGALLDRTLLSPAQSFFNAAIFPGWQKWMPTYRWGTASDINDDADTMTVTLGPATSTAQDLSVNAEPVLRDVPITYMECNSGAFFDGDRVIVQFENQSLDSPRVIGFLDNPKRCILHHYAIIGYDGLIATHLFKKTGFRIPDYTAPPPSELEPSNISYYGERAFGVFHGWFKSPDNTNPITTSYTLAGMKALASDPEFGVGTTTYDARYTLYPQYITGQYWNLEYLSHDNVTEWDLTSIYDPPPPALYTETWDWVVKGTVTCLQAVHLYFGDSIPISGSRLEVGDGFVTFISHTEAVWTSALDESIIQGVLTYQPPHSSSHPGEQYHPEDWVPPWYANIAPRPDLATFAPAITLGTIYGTAVYVLDADLSPGVARWKIQSFSEGV